MVRQSMENKVSRAYRISIALLLVIIGISVDGFHYAYGGEILRIDGSTGVRPLVLSLADTHQHSHPSLQIDIGKGLKPKARLDALIKGYIDIAMASHGIPSQLLRRHNLTAHKIAEVAIVWGVNYRVAQRDISEGQLCQIYQRKVSDWAIDFENHQPIEPLIRPFTEVDMEVIAENIACFKSITSMQGIPVFDSSGQMARAIASRAGAIGMTTQVRVAQSHGKIKALSLNGVPPSIANMKSGAYPLTRSFYLVTPVDYDNNVRDFLSFIGSDAGRAIIMDNSALPVLIP